ncbi:V-type proton ATPase 116 kDa subunit a 1 isoform X1 [Astyanax mexicanus]|uniref:V-type proton ATPase 116 kDa subunit a 1 isoform X1 n=1 Tax=Astyanax mexicanus TaxID=7994 RepID=UPI0020CB1110|nr:V-type proton ATPase 116 kDa subunit a 1 isoform X1 [Astyanax mexicanus]
MFRSEEMCLVQLFFQTESAHTCIHQLGLLGLAQFRDLNPGTAAFQRKFVKEVKRCEEMERILRFLEAEMARCAIPVSAVVDSGGVTCPRELLELECKIRKLEEELKEINCNHDALKRNFTELLEISSLLKASRDFFEEAESQLSSSELPSEDSVSIATIRRNSSASTSGPQKLGFIAGVIKQDRFPAFEKVLWRLFHENFILRHAEIQDTEQQTENTMVKKDAFVIFVQGDQVQGKIKKICDGFRASLYPCPNTLSAREQMRMSVHIRIEDLRMILRRTEEFRATVLTKAATSIQHWVNKVKKMKAIYYTLNLCNIDITQKLIVAEIWCPVSDLNSVQNALIKGSEQSGSSVSPILNRIHTQHTPPTFNRTNVFTKGFQTIVDAYGVSNYREVNPTPYTIITFPFLFAVMFGDCGHGLVLTLLAVWVIVQQKKLSCCRSEFVVVLVEGRFIILLMGLFSIYTGLIYNDCFSKSFSIYGSSWSVRHMFQPSGPWSNETLHSSGHLTLDPAVPRVYSGSPYMLGIDPVWNIASNKLSFLNSYKMKMSVILGVSHMLFGTTLSLVNYIHFRNFQNILLRFIPELVFMLSLFGYLIFLIVFKWCVQLRSETAPSILLMFINMMLFSYQSSDVFLYSEQKAVQTFLVLQALLMVPVMLLVKPLLIYRQRIKLRLQESMGDIFAYQAIYTIEHCLGCISNTASYLRLWALSLAHAELSEVLWRMLLRGGLRCTPGLGAVLLALVLCCFALLTVAVLIVMEGLSAFLHALRLHWVEFQNKFYQGAGFKFTPLSFTSLLKTQP